MSPEEKAREEIDRLLTAAGWTVADVPKADIHASRGVAIREFPLDAGFGFADYLFYVDGRAAGVEVQSGCYAQGLPAALPAHRRPLPFLYESTGVETHFTSALDPEPRARNVFAFHRPETPAAWFEGLSHPALLSAGAEPNDQPNLASASTCTRTTSSSSTAWAYASATSVGLSVRGLFLIAINLRHQRSPCGAELPR